MIIYLDYDGTVVEHAYPLIGKENPGALETILMIQNAGHTIYFNTYRRNIGDNALFPALEWFANHASIKIKIFDGICSSKRIPSVWKWKTMLITGEIYIDDITPNIPLIKSTQVKAKMVDWYKIQKELKKHNIIQK